MGTKRDGRREFNEDALDELVELCLRPGVSIARTAMDHDVNPNQLRRWITRYQQRQLAENKHDREREGVPECAVIDGVQVDMPQRTSRVPSAKPEASAFIPVVAAAAVCEPAPVPTRPMTIALHVRLPNGVQFDLGEAQLGELSTIIQMLGRLPCSGSTKA